MKVLDESTSDYDYKLDSLIYWLAKLNDIDIEI
jgi:hypothetical protein